MKFMAYLQTGFKLLTFKSSGTLFSRTAKIGINDVLWRVVLISVAKCLLFLTVAFNCFLSRTLDKKSSNWDTYNLFLTSKMCVLIVFSFKSEVEPKI